MKILEKIGDYEVLEISRKGAAKITDRKKVAWIKPAAFKKLQASGVLPPAAKKALDETEFTFADAENKKSMADGKKPFVQVKFIGVEQETDAALLVCDFQNNSSWLPKSIISGYGNSCKSLGLWVPQWWANKNGYAWKSNNVKWI